MSVPLRILIVEDSADDAEVALLELARGGIVPDGRRVESADGLRAALADGPWDAVLSDYTMPGFGAAEAFALCRAADPDLPFVVVSGTIGEQRAVEMMRAGAGDFLLKGNLGRLAAAVEREVREADNRRARRRAEHDTALLASVVASSGDAILTQSPDGVVTSWNPGAERLYGWTAAEAVGRDIAFLIPPERAEEFALLTARQERGERVQSFETVRLHKDGTRVEVAVTVSPLRDRDGRLSGYSKIVRDVGARKRADAVLRDREQLLQTIIAHIPCGVFWKDRYSVLLGCNNQFAEDFRADRPEALIGQTDDMRATSADAAAFVAGDRRVMETGVPLLRVEEQHSQADGRVTTLLTSKVPLRGPGGAVIGVLGVYQDITDRKRSEEALRQSDERLRLFVEHVSAPIAMLDRDMRYLFVSRRWLTDYKLGERDLTGLSHYDVFPDAPPRWKDIHRRCLAGEIIQCDEDRFDRGDGSVQWIRWEVRPWLATAGAVGGIIMFTEDITARKQSEEAVRHSDERLRTLIAATTAIVWTSPPSGAFDSDQPGWTAFTGQTVEQHRGWGWLDAVHPDDRAESARAWGAAVSARTAYQVEHRLRRTDGEYRDMAVRAVPVLDPDGSIREWVGVHTDVTEQKRAGEAVRASEARLRAVLESDMLATFFWQEEGGVTEANDAFLAVVGYTREELLAGRVSWADLTPPECRDRDQEALAEIARTGRCAPYEKEYVRRDGRRVPILLGAASLGSSDGVAFAIDLTERKRLEEQFRAAEQRLHHVVASSPVVLFTLAVAGDTIRGVDWIGENVLDVFGHRPESALSPDWWQANVHPEDLDRASAPVAAELFGRGRMSHEYRFRHGDGKYRWTRGDLRLIRDAADRPIEVVGSWSDITERKRLEEQYQQSQKMEAFGQLAGGVAHDFNNLLTIINGYSDMLLEQLPAADPSRPLVAEIHKAGERSAGLTRQLLAFSRRQVLATKVLDLNAVVADTANMLRRLIGEDVKLAVTLAPALWAVRADPGQVEQVLMNLAVNARDAMPTGGRLTVETRNVELDEGYARTHPDARPGSHVLLSVSDTGCGMPPEVAARVFEPFFTTKPVGQGTGLGLATLFGIVKQSGGHIGVYSEVGIGTTFKVYLPRVVPADGASEVRPELGVPPCGSETVLLVEDEGGVRGLVQLVLEGCGYTVLEAENGEAAVAAAAEHDGPIHLLITDVVMPGVGGRVVADRVAERHSGVRVLFVSGYTDDAVIRHGVLSEGVNFLQKPFSPAALAGKVRAVLDAKAAVS